MAEGKRRSVYNPEAQKKWNEKNKARVNYLGARNAARSFIRNKATKEDLEELKELIKVREASLDESPIEENLSEDSSSEEKPSEESSKE